MHALYGFAMNRFRDLKQVMYLTIFVSFHLVPVQEPLSFCLYAHCYGKKGILAVKRKPEEKYFFDMV